MANSNLPSPDTGSAAGLMNAAAAYLNKELGSLLQAAGSPSPFTQDPDIDRAVGNLRVQLEALHCDQGIEEINGLLEKAVQADIIEHLRTEIQEQIDKQIDQLVQDQVAELLEQHVPKQVRKQVETQRQELQSVHRELYNSESCRANSLIKAQKQFNDPLHTILNIKCEVCPFFPKNVNALIDLSDEKARELVKYYGLGEPFESKLDNLNWFLRTCGVGYQYVSPRK